MKKNNHVLRKTIVCCQLSNHKSNALSANAHCIILHIISLYFTIARSKDKNNFQSVLFLLPLQFREIM